MAQRTCSIDGCKKPVSKRGWCSMHYTRWLRHGDLQTDRDPIVRSPEGGLCTIDGCEREYLARGWCATHYRRWHKYGDPHAVKQQQFSSPEESFAARTEWRGDCLIWTGGRHKFGYGVISVDGETTVAHRYAWERVNGPIPEGTEIDHACHTPACVNVEHLRPATSSQNGSNRSGPQAGSRSGIRNVRPHRDKWVVELKRNRKRYYIGIYETVEEATNAAEAARQELFGEYAGRG